MISCPGCGFLMSDDERRCSSCSSDHATGPDGGHTRFDLDAVEASAGGLPTGDASSTALLERRAPVVSPMPAHVQYRERGRRGRRNLVVALVALVLLSAGVVFGLDGRGPLAGPMVEAGLAEPPAVRIPSSWVEVTSEAGRFRAALPHGAEPLDEGLAGYSTRVGEGAALTVFSTDFDLGPVGMEPYRSTDGVDELVDRLSVTFGLGDEVVRREVRAAEGWATDAVYVTDDGVTTRARFHLARDRLHVLTTTGPDSAMDELDEAHPRMLSEFRLE